MYDIFKYFSKGARKYAASKKYNPLSKEGFCPLGMCMHYRKSSQKYVPLPHHVANFLTRKKKVNLTYYNILCIQAREFIEDWDSGIIKNMKGAMGVE